MRERRCRARKADEPLRDSSGRAGLGNRGHEPQLALRQQLQSAERGGAFDLAQPHARDLQRELRRSSSRSSRCISIHPSGGAAAAQPGRPAPSRLWSCNGPFSLEEALGVSDALGAQLAGGSRGRRGSRGDLSAAAAVAVRSAAAAAFCAWCCSADER